MNSDIGLNSKNHDLETNGSTYRGKHINNINSENFKPSENASSENHYLTGLLSQFDGIDLKKIAKSHPLELIGAFIGVGALVGLSLRQSKTPTSNLRDRLNSLSSRISKSASSLADEVGKQVHSGAESLHSLSGKGQKIINSQAETLGKNLGSAKEETAHLISELAEAVPNFMLRKSSLTTLIVLAGTGIAASSLFKSSAKPRSLRLRNDTRPYEERSKEELYQRAKELGIEGRSGMSKDDLIKALRN